MTPRLAILSGGRAGTVEPLTGAVSSIGRHATCRVRLDADQDTEVSNRHAVIQKKDGVWTVRDLGSIHGTYLNGTRISEEQPLNDGDLLRLGASGPELQFLVSDRAPVAEPAREPVSSQPAKPALSAEERSRMMADELAGQLARDAARAARRSRVIRLVASVVVTVLVVSGALLVWRQQAAKRAAAGAHQREVARADSLIASVAGIKVPSPAMQASLDSAREAARRLRAGLEEGGVHPVPDATLLAGLDAAVARQRQIAAAASFNAAAVASPSAAAVGLVIVQYADGSTVFATGFGVRRDGTGGALLTTRQVVVDRDGNPAVQVTVLMPGELAPVPTQVIATHLTEDVALLRVPIRGGIPVVQGLAWKEPPVAAGAPVAIIGYPLPVELPPSGDWRGAIPRTATATGTASRVAAGFITVDSWGWAVAPGSPIIDAEGLVAGIIATAAPSAGGRLYDVVPMKFALELLDQLQ